MQEDRQSGNAVDEPTLDIFVPYDLASARIEASLAAGDRIVSNRHAPESWILADAEGKRSVRRGAEPGG